MVGLTRKQIERSKLASEIDSNVGLPPVKKFKHMVSINIISNYQISVADISNAENIYGPLMEIIKGKSTGIKPRPLIKDVIQVPSKIYKNITNIELCIDVLYITGVAFMVSIERQVKYRSIIHITSQNEGIYILIILTKYFATIIQ